VDPLRVRCFDGERYMRACQVASRSPNEGTLEERVDDVVDLIDPVSERGLPPLAGDQRGSPETIAEAYEPAYEELLAVANGR
jgi:hypothetical protein